MIVFDTDILTLYSLENIRIRERAAREDDEIAITIITQIEVLLGRFHFILKASTGDELQRAQAYLANSEHVLAKHTVLPITQAAAAWFDKLRFEKKLKKIGRPDLLIACIGLSHGARDRSCPFRIWR